MARKMKDSGIEWIGEIPEDWEIIKAKYLFKQRNTKGNPDNLILLTPSQKFGVVPQAMYEELSGFKAVKLNQQIDLSNLKTIKLGDFCISLRSFQGGFEYSNYSGVVSPAYQVFYSFKNQHNIYYKYLFKDKRFIDKMNSYTMSLRDGKNISFNDFGNSFIPHPSYEEQILISDYLDEKTSQIEDIENIINDEIESLENYKKSLITEAVTKGLDKNVPMKDSGVEWIGKIPKHWKVIKIKNAALLKARIGWQGLKSDEFLTDFELPYLVTGTDFNNGLVDWKNCVRISKQRFEMDKNIQIKENDLLITKDGTIGKLAIARNCPDKASLNSGVFVIRNQGPYKYIDKYMYYLLQSEQFYLWFELNDSGNSTIRHLYQRDFYNFSFTYPDINEQEKIVDFLDKKTKLIDETISLKQKQLKTLEEYKKSLIYEYVTGKKEAHLGKF